MNVPVGFQNWRDLLFVHWRVALSDVRRLVPRCFEIDEYEGAAYVGVVPFRVEAARPVGVPAALGLGFPETNVRTYVRVAGGEPGVYFFSLDAASLVAVLGARLSLGLPYFWATGEQRNSGARVQYSLRRRTGTQPRCDAEYEVREPLAPATPGTLDHFLIERYVLHVQRGDSLWSVRVQHQPYPLHAVELIRLRDELVYAAGFAAGQARPLVHFASGVDVTIYPPRIRSAR